MKIAVTSDFRTNFHTYSQHYRLGWLQSPILKYLKKFHNRAASTMVPTQNLLKNLQDLGFERLCHVPRGVDLQKFDPSHRNLALRREWDADDDAVVMLCVSRLAAEKNLDLVIQSWMQTKKSGIKCRLVLVGDGPMRAELQKTHPDVHFAGFRQGADLSAHYASADLFVFASITETFGNVTLEAMASGLPVLAFRSAAAGELIIDRQEGVLIETGRETMFANACIQLAGNLQGLREMGLKGRIKAMQCSWPVVIAQTVQVMRQAVNRLSTTV
jgi:glycosyltransferase involved in cell wall biosynthesis